MSTMTIKMKLYLTYGAMACLVLLMGLSSIVILHELAGTTRDLGVLQATKLFDAGMINGNSSELPSLVRGIYIRTLSGDKEKAEAYMALYAEQEQDIRHACDDMLALGMAAKGTEMVNDLKSQVDASHSVYESYIALIKAGDLKAALLSFQNDILPPLKKIDDAGNDLLVHQKEIMAHGNEEAADQVSHGSWMMTALLLVGVVIGAVLIFIIRGLDAQLRNSAHDLAEGAQQVSSAASHVSSSSQTLARATTEQAAMIEETSASAEQINSMAKRNTDSARSANLLVAEAVKNQQMTSTAVDECVIAMNQISESSTKIAKTLQVIDKIAFQTNILALNAAVEAARAGEAGMGFAVVAEEVRNLAQRCAAASEEISTLIEQSLGNSDSGRAKIATLVDSGAKVTSVFASLKVLVEEISLSGEEQSRGIEQIGRAIQKMEQGTQKSAANAEESAAAAEQLNAQSEQLHEVSGSLAAMVGAESSSTSVYRPAAPPPHPIKPRSVSQLRPTSYIPAPAYATGNDDDQNFAEF